MRFICNKKELGEALSIIGRAVSSKSSLPALEGIYIKASGSLISLSAYDLELGMSTSISAQVFEEGEIVLNAKFFTDMIRKLSADTVEIKCDDKLMTTVTSGATEFNFLGIPASEYPEMPSLTDGRQFSLPQQLLAGMIRQTLFAVSTDDTKPIHTGSLFEIENGSLRIVSVDGYRLAIRTEQIAESGSLRFVVPGKTLGEILKMLNAESSEDLTVSVGKRNILFEIDGYSVISRLLDGEFLDYRNVLGNQHSSVIRVKVRSFLDSIDRASLFISDRLKSPVRCSFDSDLIKVTCSTAIGRIYDEVNASLKGDSVEMGFNNRYLMDALKATESDEIRVELNGALSPMKIYPPEGDSFIFLVLPVRLKSEG